MRLRSGHTLADVVAVVATLPFALLVLAVCYAVWVGGGMDLTALGVLLLLAVAAYALLLFVAAGALLWSARETRKRGERPSMVTRVTGVAIGVLLLLPWLAFGLLYFVY